MILRILDYFIKILAAFLFTVFMLPFLISPTYDFPKPKEFTGEKWYNPYENMDSNNWKKGNFQIQSLAWGGITDGSNNPTDSIISRYSQLGYHIIGISDYQKINTVLKGKEGYIPIYEHGFNMHKTHQVNINTDKVLWLDFPFYQNIHHKQFIINRLRNHTDVMALAHPAFSLEGYTKEELALLGNYDLIEALNHQKFSLSHWDAALSAGKPAFILADDDAHDLNNPYLYGVVVTYINAENTSESSICSALKAGNAYGFTPSTPYEETFEKKLLRSKNLPLLKSVRISGDTLIVSAGNKLSKYHFIGQNGKEMKTVESSDSAFYVLQKSDSYIRTEIELPDNEKMFLNPVIRTSGGKPITALASVNIPKTIIILLISWIIFVGVMYWLFKRKK